MVAILPQARGVSVATYAARAPIVADPAARSGRQWPARDRPATLVPSGHRTMLAGISASAGV